MKILKYIILLTIVAFLGSCKIEEIPDPNGVSINDATKNAKKSDLQALVSGSENLARDEIGFYYDVVSIIGREYYYFTGSDPRYTGEILGKGDSKLDNAGFYGTRPYAGRYRNIRNLNVLIEAARGSTVITDAERKGYLGFAKTFQAYELLLVANMQYDNGIRIDVKDPENLGPFVDYPDALNSILGLLDEAYNDLQGAEFAFHLSSAMADYSTPESFAKFNRAISARVALYAGKTSEIDSRLQASFYDPNGNPSSPARFYSTAGGDIANNLFRVPDQADAIIAHPSFVNDAEAGDNRLSKVKLRPSGTLTLDDLSGDYDVWVFQSKNDPVPYITNEELILIAAEAAVGTDNNAAVDAINNIRNRAGLPDYSGAMTDQALMDEIMKQRRYSLFGLGHRWIDMRRWGRLGELPIDRPDDDVWTKLPRPVSET